MSSNEVKYKKHLITGLVLIFCLTMLQGCGSSDAETTDSRVGESFESEASQSMDYDDSSESEAGKVMNFKATNRHIIYDSNVDLASLGERAYNSDDTWAVYWYLCGSDLESNGGYASVDLGEMMSCYLPENVKVVIETGGSNQWQNDFVDPSKIQRYEYSGDTLSLVDEQPSASMGEASTLKDFLSFCTEEYPADHKVLVFWNHGGGSLGGVAYDEIYGHDSLSLNEINGVLTEIEQVETAKWMEASSMDCDTNEMDIFMGAPKVFEIIGFDACLMSTLSSAQAIHPFSYYMVASEEVEPGNGWNYEWLGQLGENPEMNGAQVGKVICDTFAEGCEAVGTADNITLSVVDLDNIGMLGFRFEEVGGEILLRTVESSDTISQFARSAEKSVNYGGNNNIDNYTDMVDAGDLVLNAQELLPESGQAFLDSLSETVLYKVTGPYAEGSTGLSVFYPYDGLVSSVDTYTNNRSHNMSYSYFTRYMIGGDIAEAQEMLDYLELDFNDIDSFPTFENNMSIEITDDSYARLVLDPDNLGSVKSVFFNLSYYSEEEDIIVFLGMDNDLYAEWDTGIFEDNFRGVWGSINGELCYMEITFEGDDYNLYSVPVLLNGEEVSLQVVYDYTVEAYGILGAKRSVDEETLMADKDLISLRDGDMITPIMYGMALSDDSEDVLEFYMNDIIVDEDLSFYETDLGDGEFAFSFQVVDTSNSTYDSDIVLFEYEDGEIYILTE